MKLTEENPLVERTLKHGGDIVEMVFIKAEKALQKYWNGSLCSKLGQGDLSCFWNQ